MRDTFEIPERLTGRVLVRNDAGAEADGHNDVVYTGGDVIAQLLAGKSNYRISHVYFEYENTAGTPSAGAVARTDRAADIHGYTAPRDIIRAALIAEPLIEAADGDHDGNQVTFHALTTSSTGLLNSLPFSAGSDSKIFAVCLVAAPAGSNHLQDVLYARFVLSTAVPVTGGGQASCTWITKAN
jgi:hypothetical protein